MLDIQIQQLLEAFNEPKITISLKEYNEKNSEIERLKKKYETGEKEILQHIAGNYLFSLSVNNSIMYNTTIKYIEDKGFDFRLFNGELQLSKKIENKIIK